jgi:hypothetical protein
MPTGSAAARHAFGISRAGVVMNCSSTANSDAGSSARIKKATLMANASASKKGRNAGSAMPTTAVMRMCSALRWATTAPSIASQRNSIDANSSDQKIGLWKT